MKILVPLTFIFLALASCKSENMQCFATSKCELESFDKEDSKPGSFARVRLTMRNGSANCEAYSVHCTVKLKKGNTIIDMGSTSISALKPGEGYQDEILFSDIKSHDEYSTAEVTIGWSDNEEQYHEVTYFE